jgi:hypothetical protein
MKQFQEEHARSEATLLDEISMLKHEIRFVGK